MNNDALVSRLRNRKEETRYDALCEQAADRIELMEDVLQALADEQIPASQVGEYARKALGRD